MTINTKANRVGHVPMYTMYVLGLPIYHFNIVIQVKSEVDETNRSIRLNLSGHQKTVCVCVCSEMVSDTHILKGCSHSQA